MALTSKTLIVRLDVPDGDVLDELKGRLELQFRNDPQVRREGVARVEEVADGISQSGAEAFLVVYFIGSAAVAATQHVVREFNARGIRCDAHEGGRETSPKAEPFNDRS
jgi:hypothetical protein